MRLGSRRDTIRDVVKELLGRSGAFRSLAPQRQREVTSSTVAVVSTMAEAHGAFVHDVDFPALVRDLIQGTFNAIVDASIRQMEACADLIAAVAQSVGKIESMLGEVAPTLPRPRSAPFGCASRPDSPIPE